MKLLTVPVSSSRAWGVAWLLFVAGLINYFDRAILSVALPVIGEELHLGPTAKGVLLSAFFWSYAFMQLPMGWFSDRFNLKWFYAGCFALWSAACGLTGFAGSLGVLLVMRVFLGIGEAVYLPGGMKIVSLLFDTRHRGLASGLVNCGTRLGLAVGAPIIAWLVIRMGWKSSFFAVGFLSLFWLVPWLLVYPAKAPARQGEAPPAGWGSLRHLDRSLLGLCLAHIGFAYYWYLFVTWLPNYLVESRHMSLQQAGGYAVVPYFVFSVAEPLGGWLADFLVRRGWNEMRSRKAIITAAFLTSLALLVAGRTQNDNSAVLLLGAAALVGLSTGNILALLQQVAPCGEVGLWTGILNFAGNLSGIAAPVITGVLIARTGSYYPGFVVSVAILLCGLPAYWWMVKEPNPAPPL